MITAAEETAAEGAGCVSIRHPRVCARTCYTLLGDTGKHKTSRIDCRILWTVGPPTTGCKLTNGGQHRPLHVAEEGHLVGLRHDDVGRVADVEQRAADVGRHVLRHQIRHRVQAGSEKIYLNIIADPKRRINTQSSWTYLAALAK